MKPKPLLKQIRTWIVLFMIALIISGITAFPVYSELQWIIHSAVFPVNTRTGAWLMQVWKGVKDTQEKYPFLFYGFDWLAFAHLAIAVLFIGVYKHPVRNRWIIQWAMITCISAVPLAFIAGFIRQIPLFHIFIDCSFGVIGLVPLLIVKRKIAILKTSYKVPASN